MRPDSPSKKLKTLTQGVPSLDGSLVKFEAVTTDGESIVLEIPTKNIGDFIGFLAGLAQHAEKQRTEEQRGADLLTPGGAPLSGWEGNPIDTDAIGVSYGARPGEAVLVFHFGRFSLGFSVPPDQIPALRAAVAHMEAGAAAS